MEKYNALLRKFKELSRDLFVAHRTAETEYPNSIEMHLLSETAFGAYNMIDAILEDFEDENA